MTEQQKTGLLGEIFTLIGLSLMGIGLFFWFGFPVTLTICGFLVTAFGVLSILKG